MEVEDIAPNTYLQLIQSVWAESRACTLCPYRLDQLYVFGTIFPSSILRHILYRNYYSMTQTFEGSRRVCKK